MTLRSYTNKILKEEGLQPLPKKTNLIGNNYMAIIFESLKENVSALKKDKVLSKDEADILHSALHKAIAHGPLLDMYDDIVGRIVEAQKILRGGRSKQNMGEALDLIMDRKKGAKHAEIDWQMLADDYRLLTKDRERPLTPIAAINEIMGCYNEKQVLDSREEKIANLQQKKSLLKKNSAEWKHIKKLLKQIEAMPVREIHIPASAAALLRGLKRFKQATGDSVLIEALETLPWLDELENTS